MPAARLFAFTQGPRFRLARLGLAASRTRPQNFALARAIHLGPAALLAALFALGCKTSEKPGGTGGPVETANKGTAGQLPANHPPTGEQPPTMGNKPPSTSALSWTVPPDWETAPNPSPMRKATYKVKAVDGDKEDAEMSVTALGGSVDDNVKRWEGQFSDRKGDVKRETKKVGDFEVTIVEITGTYAGMAMPSAGPSEPKSNYSLLAAIVPTGDDLHFFKLTGPEKTVAAARPAFDRLVESFLPR